MIDKRYRISAAMTGEERELEGGATTCLEIEDYRVDADDIEGRIEIAMKRVGSHPGSDEELAMWLSTEEAGELRAVLNVILGTPHSVDLVLVNGPDALR